MNIKQEMLKALKELKAIQNDHEKLIGVVYNNGLCLYLKRYIQANNVYASKELLKEHYHAHRQLRNKLFRSWGHYSGNILFPISTKNLGYQPVCLFKDMWAERKYAELRWNLVDHMIAELEEEL